MKNLKNLKYLIGLPLEQAIEHVEQLGFTWRIKFTNGTPLLLTQDVNPGRINMEVKDGVVIGIDVG